MHGCFVLVVVCFGSFECLCQLYGTVPSVLSIGVLPVETVCRRHGEFRVFLLLDDEVSSISFTLSFLVLASIPHHHRTKKPQQPAPNDFRQCTSLVHFKMKTETAENDGPGDVPQTPAKGATPFKSCVTLHPRTPHLSHVLSH